MTWRPTRCVQWHRTLLLAVASLVAARPPNVLVVASSRHNHTMKLGLAIAEGAREAASNAASTRVLAVTEANFSRDVLGWADAVVLGSPTHFGNPSAEMLGWVEAQWGGSWSDPRMGNKVGAVFATGGGLAQGVEHVLTSLARTLYSFRVRLVVPDPSASPTASYGAVAITGTPPWFNATMSDALDPIFLADGRSLGARVAQAAAQQLK